MADDDGLDGASEEAEEREKEIEYFKSQRKK